MNWNKLEKEETLAQVKAMSSDSPIVIFKHSTRCPISSMALSRIERSWKEEEMKAIKPYFLDLIAYRSLSSKVAEVFNIQHESPQILLIEKGECIYNASHMNISYEELKKAASV